MGAEGLLGTTTMKVINGNNSLNNSIEINILTNFIKSSPEILFIFMSCSVLALLFTIIIFLMFGRPSNWFRKEKENGNGK